MTFVFYDTETTGTDTSFDQVIQFGAIKTDDEMNEIDRFEIRCRLMPHVVPSPRAMQVTRVTPFMLTDPFLPSYFEAVQSIYKKMKKEQLKSMMILQIHDELLFEGPPEEMDKLSTLVVDEMEAAMSLSVPLKVDWKIGKNWYEAH